MKQSSITCQSMAQPLPISSLGRNVCERTV
jgi:hypothetical protein